MPLEIAKFSDKRRKKKQDPKQRRRQTNWDDTSTHRLTWHKRKFRSIKLNLMWSKQWLKKESGTSATVQQMVLASQMSHLSLRILRWLQSKRNIWPFSSASSKEASLIMFYDQKHKPHLPEIYSHPCLPCSWTFMELLCLKKYLQEGKGYTNSITMVSALLYNTWQVVDSPLCQNFIKSWESGSTQESTSIDFLGTRIIMGFKSIVSSQSPQIMLCMPSIHITPISWVNICRH